MALELEQTSQRAVADFMERLQRRYPHETEFLQAVHEVARYVLPYELSMPEFRDAKILERLTEPDRAISFRVVWYDDKGQVQVNRGYRIQWTNALGPYKGGLRFHPTVNFSIIKFLAFEQVFKNSLTGLQLGAGKGGADFDPRGRSDDEIRRFCQAFMLELHKHIGRYVDVPAGDIGVGPKEIGYMYGTLLKLRHYEPGAFTGKTLEIGGSYLRPEATGYGLIYFAREMLKHAGEDIVGRTAVISGSGNVAQYAAEKLLDFQVKILTLSDSTGFIYFPDGLTREQLEYVKQVKSKRRSLREVADRFGLTFYEGQKPWNVKAELAFPCATQNELTGKDAEALIKNGCRLVAEGANMPSTPEAIARFQQAGVLFGPGKAANAGGVAVSGLEMVQNAQRVQWAPEEVDQRLQEIMRNIHERVIQFAGDGRVPNYIKGANIAGYDRVARAIVTLGVI